MVTEPGGSEPLVGYLILCESIQNFERSIWPNILSRASCGRFRVISECGYVIYVSGYFPDQLTAFEKNISCPSLDCSPPGNPAKHKGLGLYSGSRALGRSISPVNRGLAVMMDQGTICVGGN